MEQIQGFDIESLVSTDQSSKDPYKDNPYGFKVDIRKTKRTKYKFITTVEGVPNIFDHKKILKALKKITKSNGAIKEDKQKGTIF